MTQPMRLVSLTCSNTEILEVLGLLPWLVGVDDHSDSPGIEHAVRVGPDLGIDVEKVAALQPDLVLASLSVPGMEKVLANLTAADLPLLTLDPVTLDDVWTDIATVGEATGQGERAEREVARLRAELAEVGDASRAALTARGWTRPPRVAVEWWPKPIIVATGESWVTPLMRELGAENAFAGLEGRSRPLELAEVAAAEPDLMTCSWCGVGRLRPEVMRARGLDTVVVPVPESGLGRPGPRLLEGARAVAAALAELDPA